VKRRLVRRNRWPNIALLVCAIALAAVLGALVFWLLTRGSNPLPANVQSSLTFSPFVLPSNSPDYTVGDYKVSTAENKVQILSYVVAAANGTKVTVSQYPQPPEFTEITEYKERFLTNVAKQYATVQTANGTIYLGRLTKQDNKQVGILLDSGLIVFMNPSKELGQTEWRKLGDQLEIQKVRN
jgi:hypothetical protein